MNYAEKFGLSVLIATCCLAIVFVLDNAHHLKESIKEKIQVTAFLCTLIFGQFWFSHEDSGIESISKMMVLVFANIALSGILRPPIGPDDSMDIG